MKYSKGISIAIAVIVVLVVVGGVGLNMFNFNSVKEDVMNTTEQENNKLQINDLLVGAGDEAVSGKTVSVHYTGMFSDGSKFDSSRDRGVPFDFVLGAGQVIKGWDQGVQGMKVGGKRLLIIPSDLAYGDAGYGPIPAKATLYFEVELLGVK